MNITDLPTEIILEIYKKCDNWDLKRLSKALNVPIPYTEPFIIKAGKRRKYNVNSICHKIISRAMIMDIQIWLEQSRKQRRQSKEKFYKGLSPYKYAIMYIPPDRFY